MASQSPPIPQSSSQVLKRTLSLPINVLKSVASEPAITGALLYVLTRGPPALRERLLGPFRKNVLAKNEASRVEAFVKILKVLTAVGVAKRINQALNRLAWNNWSIRRQGAPFKFGRIKEELVVVTGGSSGFGYEMVKGFAGIARVVVLDIADFPEELANLPDVYFYRCDVTDTADLVDVCKDIKRIHGSASVLINNAGIGIGKTVLETTNEQCEKLFKINLISHFVLIREFLPGMLDQRKGHIVTIASMASFFAAPGLLDYCCSKVGALFLSEGIRAECLTRYPGGEGICTTSVHPSWHATGIISPSASKSLSQHGIRLDPPKNVADAVIKQVQNARSGRLVIPASEEGKTGFRGYPMWLQDVMFSFPWKSGKGFQFGRGKESVLQE